MKELRGLAGRKIDMLGSELPQGMRYLSRGLKRLRQRYNLCMSLRDYLDSTCR